MSTPAIPIINRTGVETRAGITVNEAFIARFWSKVQKGSMSECWEWLACRRGGYGKFGIGGSRATMQANRAAWIIANGPIPPGMYVLHTCDNRGCVNPAHLFLGSHAENMKDMRVKDRRKGRLCGNANPNAKLSDDLVHDIRRRVAEGESKASVARRFGISDQHVADVATGRRWRHVTTALDALGGSR